jgi:predicted permease
MNDLKFAFRQLLKNPGFTAVAVLTLALGIGANTAIFSLVDAVLLKSLPVHQPERLFFITSGNNAALSYPLVERFQQANNEIGETFAYRSLKVRLGVGGNNDVVLGQLVSGNYFSSLGVAPQLGRHILPDDDRAERPPVALLSHGCWERRFGSDASVVGRSLELNGVAFTVIGVAPLSFHGLEAQSVPEVFVPVQQHALLTPAEPDLLKEYGSWVFTTVFRLKTGVAEDVARGQLTRTYQQVVKENAREWIREKDLEEVFSRGVRLLSAGRGTAKLRDQFSRPLLVLMSASGLVLLVACANVAGLLLARGTSRRREITLRLAVGASRWRIVRQLMIESLLRTGFGCLLGLLMAIWGSQGLAQLLPEAAVGLVADAGFDPRLAGFSMLVAGAATLLVGLVPAIRGAGVSLDGTLGEGGRVAGTSVGVSRFGNSLVISQVAVSLILLVGAGLFIRSLRELVTLDPGFQRDNVILLVVQPELAGYSGDEQERLAARLAAPDLMQRLELIPGVRSASLASSREFGDRPWWRMAIKVMGAIAQEDDRTGATMRWVSPKHFGTLGIPVLRGRAVGDADTLAAPKVAVINETMARQYFGDTDPLGRRIKLSSGLEALGEIEVVGVARDTKATSLRETATAMFYLPFEQFPNTDNLIFAIRHAGAAQPISLAAREVIESLDANLAITRVTTLSKEVEASLVQERATATLSTGFGVLALLLASLGLYGVLAHAVNRRTREIGVRLALGAQRRDVLRLIAGQGMKLVLAGMVVGLLGAIGVARLLTSLLYGVRPIDPPTFASVCLLLIGTALFACWLPARRAAKVDPMEALRHE